MKNESTQNNDNYLEGREHLIRKIWLENRDTMKSVEIFQAKLADFFDDVVIDIGHSFKNKDFVAFVNMIKIWKKEEDEKIALEEINKLDSEEADQLQDHNRKVMIVLLSRTLNMYEKNPKMLKNINVAEIRRLYQTVQAAEERKKSTELQRSKLNLDVVRTILPYARMTPEKLEALHNKSTDAIEKIRKLKSQGKGSGFGGITEIPATI